MDENLLAQLRQFLGLADDAAPEELIAALEQLISTIGGSPEADQSGMMSLDDETVGAMRSALGAEDNAALSARFQQFVDTLKAHVANKSSEGEAAPVMNLDALAAFNATYTEKALKSEPVKKGGNFMTSNDKTGKKSRTYGNIIQAGKAHKPGILDMARDFKAGKAQSYQIGPAGGFIMNIELANEILPALRDALPLMDMGVRHYEMQGTEALTIPAVTSEMTAYWVGETTEIPDTEELFGTKTLYPKPLAARVIVPNKFLQNANLNYEAQARNDMEYQLNRAIMNAALFGTGGVSGSNTGAQPQGLTNNSNITSTAFGLPGTAGGTPTLTEMVAAMGRVEDAKINDSPTEAWLFSPRTKRVFTNMTDANNLPILRESWATGEEKELLGKSYYTSTVIPNNQTVGTSTDCSTVFYGDWQFLAFGMSSQVEILVNPYRLSNKLQTELQAVIYADLVVLYDEAFQVMPGARSSGV